jgi:hypothetical protein
MGLFDSANVAAVYKLTAETATEDVEGETSKLANMYGTNREKMSWPSMYLQVTSMFSSLPSQFKKTVTTRTSLNMTLI